MTIHAAKGLEFPVVCVADLGRAARNEQGALLEVAERRARRRCSSPSLGGGLRESPAPEWERIKEEKRRADDAEERRIFYVAMTRARGPPGRERGHRRREVARAEAARRADELDLARVLAPGACAELGGESGLDQGGALRGGCRRGSARRAAAGGGPRAGAACFAGRRRRAAIRTEPPRLRAGAVGRRAAGGAPVYSALASYQRCGYRFHLERGAGLRRSCPSASGAVAGPAASAARRRERAWRAERPAPARADPPRPSGRRAARRAARRAESPLARGSCHELLEARRRARRPVPPPRRRDRGADRGAHGAAGAEDSTRWRT